MVKIISESEVMIRCKEFVYRFIYIGIESKNGDNENIVRSKSLNDFLVMGKQIEIEIYKIGPEEHGYLSLIGELFSGGESVNLRLIKSGLVNYSQPPLDFDRLQSFELAQASTLKTQDKYQELTPKDLKLKLEPTSVPEFGCGTLPCFNRK